MTLMLPLLLAGNAHAQAIYPRGADVDPAIFIDLTEAGTAQFEGIAQSVLPPTIPIDGIAEGDQIGSGLLGAGYQFEVGNLIVMPEIPTGGMSVVPRDARPDSCRPTVEGNGTLDVDLNLNISLNKPPESPAFVDAEVTGSFLGLDIPIVDSQCDLRLYDLPIRAQVDVEVGPQLDEFTCLPNATPDGCIQPDIFINAPRWCVGYNCTPTERGSIELSIDDLNFDCNGLIGFLLDVADFLSIDAVELLVRSIEPQILGEVDNAIAEAQTAIDDAVQGLIIEEELDLLGTIVTAKLCPTVSYINSTPSTLDDPSGLEATNEGVRFGLKGSVVGPELAHPCIADVDPGGSRRTVPSTGERFPLIGDYDVSLTPDFEHFVALFDDDFANQALYEVWRTGLLCQTITSDAAPIDLPIPLDSSLLGLLAAGEFDEFIPPSDPKPLLLQTRPERPPILRMEQSEQLASIEVSELGIDFYAELDGRLSRFVGMNLTAQAGVAADFDGSTGQLGAQVLFSADEIQADVVFNDLKPSASDKVENGLYTILDSLVGPLLNDLLEPFTFDLPAFQGIGVSSMVIAPAGPGQDWAGIFGRIDPNVSYGDPAGGCDLFDTGGTGGGGCDLGCSQGGRPGGLVLLFGPLALVALRRRR